MSYLSQARGYFECCKQCIVSIHDIERGIVFIPGQFNLNTLKNISRFISLFCVNLAHMFLCDRDTLTNGYDTV